MDLADPARRARAVTPREPLRPAAGDACARPGAEPGARRRRAARPRPRTAGPAVLVDDVSTERRSGTTRWSPVARRASRSSTSPASMVPLRRAEVGPGVFVPRPETELLAGWAIEGAALDAPVVVDLCTGSGAIARAVVHGVPDARVHAVELDEPAYGWAERNLAGTGVDLRQGDFATAFDDLSVRSTSWSATRRTSRSRPGSRWRPRRATTTRTSRCSPASTASTRSGSWPPHRGAASARGSARGRARRRPGRVGAGRLPAPVAGPRCATTATWQVVRASRRRDWHDDPS